MEKYRMGITLREEESVLEIMDQVGNITHGELDPELQQLIRQGQIDLETEYQNQATQRMLENRMGFNFDELEEDIIPAQISQQTIEIPQGPKTEQNELITFEQETLNKTKKTQQEIMELDQEFPKLNYTGMVGKHQNIMKFATPKASTWAQKSEKLVSIAMVCIINDKRWILMVTGDQLLVFIGEDQEQPKVIQMKNDIGAISISPCKKYIGIAAGSQLSIYQIKKLTNIVPLKHFSDLKVNSIMKMTLYQGNGPKICLSDETTVTYQILMDIGMILTKIKIEVINHQLDRIDSLDVVRVDGKIALLAIGGAGAFHLAKIEPDVQFYHKVIAADKVTVSWRRLKDKISLLVASDSKLRIYRLVFYPQENVYSLEEHLLFVNHYPIDTIVRLSPFHYLLQSQVNCSIVALPLIPSVVEGPELTLSEAALVNSFDREPQTTIIFGCDDGILMRQRHKLKCGSLKGLEQEADELMIQKCAFREAFSLLVLVSKGINYSFNFTYQLQDLKRVIHSAIQIATQALIPSLDDKIVLFRVGWVVQLCLQCSQQKYMWTYFYPNLKEKHLQKHLFNMIQMFILKGQLKQVPEQVFLDIISFYSERGKEGVIEKLVLSNREQYEASKLLSLLNQREMNYLQFYLFSRAIISDQHDFYTPFIRAFSAFVKNQENQHPRIKDSALLCFWILSKTFNFEYVPSGKMTRDTKIHISTSFFLQSLSKTIIRRLSDYDIKLYLECYLVPFLNPEFKELLVQEEQQLLSTFREYDIAGQIAQQSEFVNAFLSYLEYCSPLLKLSSLFAEYYCTVLFLSKSQLKFERVIQLLSSLFQKKFYHYNLRAFVGTRPPVKELKTYLLAMIQGDLQKRSDHLYIKKLLAYEDREISHLLYKINKNYQTALQKYISNFGVEGIFQFLQEIVKELSEMKQDNNCNKEKKKEQIRKFVVKNIGLLFRTNSDKALEICYLAGQNTQQIHEIMFRNLFWDRERILFLTAVLKYYENQDFQYRQQYLLEHLEQVCLLPESEMRTYLNNFLYPLDPALKVADRKNNHLAIAILHMRSGHVEQAITSYQKLIQTTLVNNKDEEQTKQKITTYVRECIEICKQHSGETLNDNLWIRLIRFLSSFVASEHRYKISLKVQLEKCTQIIINEMLRFLSTSLLIDFFTAPSLPLPSHKLLSIYDELYRMVKFDRSTIQRSILIAFLNILENRQLLSAQTYLGMTGTYFCDFCRGRLEEQHNSLLYSCGHAFHKLCHEDRSICLSCSYESDELLFYKIINKKKEPHKDVPAQKPKDKKKKIELPKEIYVQSKNQTQLQSRKKKLKLYDYSTKLHNDLIIELSNPVCSMDQLELHF